MKRTAIRISEGIMLLISLAYLSTLGITAFFRLRQLLPVEWVIYKPLSLIEFYQTAVWCAIALAIIAIVLEWKREKRKVTYAIYLTYLSAPFIVSLVLFLVTAWKIAQIHPIGLELMEGKVSTDIIPFGLVVIVYMLFPIAHFTLNRIQGRSSREDQFRYGSASTP